MWKILKVDCRKWVHGQKNQGKGGRNGERHAWIAGYDVRSWKLPSKQGLLAK